MVELDSPGCRIEKGRQEGAFAVVGDRRGIQLWIQPVNGGKGEHATNYVFSLRPCDALQLSAMLAIRVYQVSELDYSKLSWKATHLSGYELTVRHPDPLVALDIAVERLREEIGADARGAVVQRDEVGLLLDPNSVVPMSDPKQSASPPASADPDMIMRRVLSAVHAWAAWREGQSDFSRDGLSDVERRLMRLVGFTVE